MVALLAFVALALAPDDPSAKLWAEGLASERPEERLATIDAIDAQGLRALGTLREIVARFPGRARREAVELLDRISHRRLLRASHVALGPNTRDVAAAVAALREQTGFPIDFVPEEEQKWRARPVEIGAANPVPFFEAMDRLGASGGFRIDLTNVATYRPKGGMRLRVIADDGSRPAVAYAGPYRVALVELERHRSVAQARNAADATVREEFAATLEVLAEPGILVERNGSIRIQEAVDEKGRDLRAPQLSETHPPQAVRPWSQESLGTFTARVPLHLPADRGQRIACLSGVVPILALVRTDEIFSVPLEGLQGKNIDADGVSMRVNRVEIGSGAGSLEITIRGESPPGLQGFAAGPRQTGMSNLRLSYSPDDHLRIEDSDGQPYTTSSNATSPPGPDGVVAYRVSLFPGRPLKPAARIRYFGVAGVATEIPFEFRDLPIP